MSPVFENESISLTIYNEDGYQSFKNLHEDVNDSEIYTLATAVNSILEKPATKYVKSIMQLIKP